LVKSVCAKELLSVSV